MMQVRDDLELGVSTHTGPVRGSNEDDYVLIDPEDDEVAAGGGRLFAVADGMGGVAGGAEASRIAIRGLAGAFLARTDATSEDRMRDSFGVAAKEVYKASRSSAQLADMGTTLTSLSIQGDRAIIGHVGDSRCLRLRDRSIEQLTDDHAVEEPRHLLTRCLGAGRDHEEVDVHSVPLEPGDTFVLMSDGAWGPLDPIEIAACLRQSPAQEAADRIVQLALDAGTTDNATVLVVRVHSVAGLGQPVEVELPREEASLRLSAPALDVSSARWPWVVLVVGVLVIAVAVAKLVFGVDLIPWRR